MPNDYYNYENVVRVIDESYDTSAAACDAINDAGLTPEQFYQTASKNVVDTGIKYRVNGDGNVNSIFNNMSTNLSDGDVAQSVINSNAQSGTASQSVNVQYATESTVNQSGKVELSAGVTKYTTGQLAPTSGFKAVVGSVASGVAAYATGVSLGKAIDATIYNTNPAFFDSIGLNSLNPATWNSITSDMSDTGVEGVLKKTFNFLLGLNDDGSTQAYIDADAYNYIAYALAQAGIFDQAGDTEHTATLPAGRTPTVQQPVYTMDSAYFKFYDNAAHTDIREYTFTNLVNCVVAPYTDGGGYITPRVYKINNSLPASYTLIETFNQGRPSTYNITSFSSANYYGYTFYYNLYGLIDASRLISTTAAHINNAIQGQNFSYTELGYIIVYGTATTPTSLPGVSDQTGATVPTGIDSSSTQQQVTDAISQQLPGLYDNRIEQKVVQPDGTTITKIYYPVPIPTNTTNTTTTEPHTITIDQPIRIILPDGATITLPDGTVVTGDGVSIITLPPGTYTLPTGTKIIGNPVADPEGNPGDTQTDPVINDDSTDDAKDFIKDTVTRPQPVPTPDPDGSTQPDSDTDPVNPNPSDTGEGTSPVDVIPTGNASAMYSVYNPTLSEINSLGAWLWSSNFIDQLLKMFNDPMQAIIGLHKTYITPSVSGRGDIKVGYLNSGVQANLVPTQYSTMDCGSVNLPEYFGNVFDYSPYTRVFIYLPFIGFKELDVSQVMRSRIGVKYRGDAYTGTGLAEISVTRDGGAGGVLYSFGCECAVRYPLSQGSYMGFASAVAGLAVGVASGNVVPALLGFSHGSSKPAVEHSGSFSGNSGAMGIKKPYLVVMRPQTAMPRNYQHFSGAPSSSLITVGEASGLIRVRECHVEQINNATREEKLMIETALKEGVIV